MKFVYLFLLALLLHCTPTTTKQTDLIVGEYSSPQNTYLNRLKYGTFVVDLNLKLRTDSTFEFKSCSQITKGIWCLKNDTIELKCLDKSFIIDSLNHIEKYSKGKPCGSDEKLVMNCRNLYREEKMGKKNVKFIFIKK